MDQHDLLAIQEKAQITQRQLEFLNPYFDSLIENIHKKWEELSLEDGNGAKLLKFQLRTVIELRRAMIQDINHGKQAAKKLEGV